LRKSADASHEITVPRKNSEIGNQIAGQRGFTRRTIIATIAAPSTISNPAMVTTGSTAAAPASINGTSSFRNPS
jgi:hypothetical protein